MLDAQRQGSPMSETPAAHPITARSDGTSSPRPCAYFGQFVLQYVLSQLKVRYRQAWMGRVWNVLEPLLFLGVLTVVFSVLNQTNLRDYALYLFAGLVPWRYLERSIMGCVDSIADGGWLLRRIAAPACVLPLTAWLLASADFLFGLIALALVLAFLADSWTIHLVCVLPAALLVGVLGLGLGTIFAVLNVFARDVKPLLQVALMLLFFSSPVLVKQSAIPVDSQLASIFSWHPVTPIVGLFQQSIYQHAWPPAHNWMIVATFAFASLALGWILLARLRHRIYFYL
jgi:ABC-type polysaccharide/polyol phosphate export permease